VSSIVTFYSYKGGVGRSMALANVAVLLAQRGLKVLAVDWDLEAPGLERYFSYFSPSSSGKGLLRLLISARDGQSTNLDDFASRIDCKADHPIVLLGSGRDQDEDYSRNLETFDWPDFFANGGGAFLERLRDEWRRDFDIVLIDSRTGLSDAGGICTIQMPDAVVAMFTANYQSLYGARDVLRLAQKARQSLAYDRMPLSVLPLPSRWGVQEFQETQIWLERIVDGVQEFYADWLPRPLTPRQVLEITKIPHHSYFGFGERLAAVEQGTEDPTGMGFVYDKVAQFLASDFKNFAALVGQKAAEAVAAEETKKAPSPAPKMDDYAYDIYVSFDRSTKDWVIDFVESLRDELARRFKVPPRVFVDVQEVDVGSDNWAPMLIDAIKRSRVMLVLITPDYFKSRWAARELELFADESRRRGATAASGRPPVVPVFVSGGSTVGMLMPPELRTLNYLDVSPSEVGRMARLPRGRRPSEWFAVISRVADILGGMLEDVDRGPRPQITV